MPLIVLFLVVLCVYLFSEVNRLEEVIMTYEEEEDDEAEDKRDC